MNKQIQTPTPIKPQNTFLKRVGLATGAAATYVLATAPAYAAELDFSGFGSEIDGIKTAIVSVITFAIGIMAIVVGWSMFKRAAGRV